MESINKISKIYIMLVKSAEEKKKPWKKDRGCRERKGCNLKR